MKNETQSFEQMDYKDFGFTKKTITPFIQKYLLNVKDGHVHMTAYKIMPGIELYCTDYQTQEHFSGKVNECEYYQIAYAHKGIYESRIDGHRFLRLAEGEISMMTNTYQSFDSRMPMGYYQGVNIIIYPGRMDADTVRFFSFFDIEIDLLFQKHLQGKRFERFVCDTHIIKVLESLYEATRDGDQIHMKIHLLHLLTEFVHYEGAKQRKYYVVTDKKMETISEIKTYIEKNSDKHFTIRELAVLFHISETSLKNNFKLLYGCSPYEFLKRIRMRIAADLLLATNDAIAEIGSEVGYENPSKFSSAFSSVYGISPIKYRNNS